MDPIVPKTPILQDKRLYLAVATILSLLAMSVLKIDISPESIAAVIAVVITYITNSAVKEAAVAKALASQPGSAMAVVNEPPKA